MPRINLLDKSVYNQISAGEVVENPASIVKELVENSIDAGADSINIEIESGGIKSIVVSDDGCGMEREDLLLSVMPHATSKISVAADLNTVGTLGFRGEALASIASVSDMTIKSRYFEDDSANFLQVKGGEHIASGVCGFGAGTQVTVRSLFFNTPARYKFLKNTKGEENNVTAVVGELIFANPDTAFTYTVDGRIVYQTSGDGLEDAIRAVYGEETAANMLSLRTEEKGYKISGFTARPASAAIRNNRLRQVFIVNGRVIEDPALSAVVANAYGEFLMKRTFPSVVVDMLIPFELVDVNVHPNKREVRFADRKVVSGLIYHAVKNAVEDDAEETQRKIFASLNSRTMDFSAKKQVEAAKEVAAETDDNKERLLDDSIVNRSLNRYDDAITPFKSPDFTMDKVEKNLNFADSEDKLFHFAAEDSEEKLNYKTIGQLFDTYLLLEIEGELIVLDQHAAHERLLYDRLIADADKSLAVQDLLFPFTYAVNAEERSLLLANKDNFERLGFRMEISGSQAELYSVPCILTNLDLNGFIAEIIQFNKTFSEFASSSVAKDKIAKIACKRAIKGGDRLSDEQIEEVLNYFFACGVPLQCPHGRPTVIKITREEIEKRFGRRA